MSKIYVDEIAPKTSGGLVKTPTKPIWFGMLASAQTMTRASIDKITGFTVNEIDTANAFDGTTFTVPSGMAGVYSVTFTMFCDFTGIGNDGETVEARIYVNDASYIKERFSNSTTKDSAYMSFTVTTLIDLSAGDTVDVRGYLIDNDGGNAQVNATHTTFGGFFVG